MAFGVFYFLRRFDCRGIGMLPYIERVRAVHTISEVLRPLRPGFHTPQKGSVFRMSPNTATPTPTSTAEEVVSTEVKVCTQHGTCLPPDACAMAEELYRLVTMGCDAYLHLLPHVQDPAIKTDITAAMCFYEKLTGKVQQILTDNDIKPREGSRMSKMSARAGIAMNVARDRTDSHVAEMLIEGGTMSITAATELSNRARGQDGCGELVMLCDDWVRFEQTHIDALKKYL